MSLEDIADATPEDVEHSNLLMYRRIYSSLSIKPVKEKDGHYEEIKPGDVLAEGEALELGLYEKNFSRGVVKLSSPANYPGIFSLMQNNEGAINEHLEECGLAEKVQSLVTPNMS